MALQYASAIAPRAAIAAEGDPVVTLEDGVNGCNGVRTTPGSENTDKELIGGSLVPGGTAIFRITFPVDPSDVAGRTTFVITDCVFVDGNAVLKYSVSFVPNTVDYILTFSLHIPAGTPIGAEYCNYAKTTAAPSESQASNRKAGPACFIVGGNLAVLKVNEQGDPLAGATFHIVCTLPRTDSFLPDTIINGETINSTSGLVITRNVTTGASGRIVIQAPVGTSCVITETEAPPGYEIADDPSVTLVATANGVEHTFVNTVPPPPTVQLTKTVDDDSKPEPGGVFHFTLTIWNTSAEPVTITALTDDNALSQACLDLIGDTLAATNGSVGGADTTSCTYDVTHTNAGTYPNEAEVTVEDSDQIEASDKDNESVTVTDVPPIIATLKAADPTSLPEPGGNVTFTVTVTNNSGEAVTITSLNDNIYGALVGDADCQVGTTLAIGASCSFNFVGAVNGNAGLVHTNIATVCAEDNDETEDCDDDDATVTITDVASTINVVKTANPTSLPEPGGNVTFTVVVTNTSTVDTLTISSLNDNIYGVLVGDADCQIGTVLAVSASCSFTFVGAVNGNAGSSHTDIVTVCATDNDTATPCDTDDATVTLTDVPPTIVVTKDATPANRDEPGGTFTFSLDVHNTSFEPVTLTILTDDKYGNLLDASNPKVSNNTCATASKAIAPDGHFTCSFGGTFTGDVGASQTDRVDTTVVDNDESTATAHDDATVAIINVNPDITVVKTADPLTLPEPGGDFTFNVSVHNGSIESVTLTSLVDDVYGDLDGKGTCATGGTLAVGATYTCHFTGSFIGDALETQTDTVTATVEDNEGNPASNFNDATVSLTNVPPTIDVTKDANPDSIGPGDTVTFTVKVKNTSVETVKLTKLTDSIYGDLNGVGTCVADGSVSIAVGATYTCSFNEVVSATETDTVTARVIDNELTPVEGSDNATVTVNSLTLEKTNNAPIVTLELPDGSTADLPTADEGDTVTYTLTYTFAGDSVTNGVITDVLPLGVTYVPGSATNDAQFTFQGYDAGTRTLTWTAATVDESGSLSYQATVNPLASGLTQPLVNVAAIDSDQTPSDDADSQVFVATIPESATGTPRVTLPPTDALAISQEPSSPGFGLMLILFALAAVVLVVGFVTPVPAPVRRRTRR